jgi:flagellar FliL protein
LPKSFVSTTFKGHSSPDTILAQRVLFLASLNDQGGPVPDEKKKPEEEQAEQPKAKSSFPVGKILSVLMLVLLSSAGSGFTSWYVINRSLKAEGKAGEAGHEAEKKEDVVAEAIEKGAALPLEPFVVNLADADAARYLRIKVSLMIDDKNKAKEVEENTALQLKIRDVILQSLTQKTSKDLINEEGKTKLRHEIHERITGYFKEPKLVEVMFTEFVIQL